MTTRLRTLLCTSLWISVALVSAAHASALDLDRAGRPAEDQARDAGRKPSEVVAVFGIQPGMTVVDLIAAGGYYTEVLSIAVGPEGKVYAQNNDFVLKMRDGANDKAMTARLANDRLPNVERLDRALAEIGLAPGSVDAAVTALNFHDVYNANGPEAALAFLRGIYTFLKPGGVLGIVDHHGSAGADNEKLHRIEEAKVLAVIAKSGFEVDGSSDVLRNPDDRTQNVFAPGLRGHTDRFVLRLRKPS